MRSDRERDAEMDRLLRAVMSDELAAEAGACPPPDVLAAYAERTLSEGERRAMDLHLASCAVCQEAMALVATMPDTPATAVASHSAAWWRAGWKRWLVPLGAAATAVVLYVAVKPDEVLKPAAVVPSRESVVASAPSQLPAAAGSLDAEPAATPDTRPATPAKQRIAPSASPAQPSRLVELRARTKDVSQGSPEASKPPRVEALPETIVAPARPQELAAPTTTFVAAPVAAPPPPPPPPAQSGGARGQAQALPVVRGVGGGDVARKQAAAEAPPARRLDLGPESVVVTGESPLVASATRVLVAAAGNPKVQWSLHGPRISRSDDGGQSWHEQYTASAALLAGASASATTCWAVGAGGLVLLTTDGKSWEPRPFPERVDLTAVTAAGGTAATVTTRDGRRFGTEDGGNSWTPIK